LALFRAGRLVNEVPTAIQNSVLGTINASAPPLPDGSGRKVELRLTDKSRITVQISDESDDQPFST